jgi:hypothetical protein
MRRLDEWLDRGPFTWRDLGIYRIIFAGSALLTLPNYRWVSDLPSSFFVPPAGPFSWATTFPPHGVMIAAEISLAIALVLLLIGLWTTPVSLLVCAVTIFGEGFSYSAGKIDHSILMTIVPGIMAFSRWGTVYSVDSLRSGDPDRDSPPQWPLRLLAFAVASSMLTAALPKALNGWLSLSTQATFGYEVSEFFVHDRQSLLAPYLVGLDAPWLWEALDWGTVAIEGGLFLAALSWRSWRIAISILALFHLAIYLSLNIPFWPNVIAYGAFVSWGMAPGLVPLSRRVRFRVPTLSRVWWMVISVLTGGAIWAASLLLGNQVFWFGWICVMFGAALALSYLSVSLVGYISAWRRQPGRHLSESPIR